MFSAQGAFLFAIYNSEYGKDAFPGKGNLRAEDDKIRKLMRDNIDLKEENEILKKTMAIFSRDVK